MKKILLAVSMLLIAFPLAAQTGCTPGGGVSCTTNLQLWLLPPHYQNWGVPWNDNANAVDALAGVAIINDPVGSQTINEQIGYYLNLNSVNIYGSPSWLRFGASVDTPDSALTRTGAGAFSLDTTTPGNAAAVLNLGGIKFGGSGGTSGQCVASDGVSANTFVNCITSIGSLFYQTIEIAGSDQTQRPTVNFSAYFTGADSASPARTNIDLVTTGNESELVTAASAGTSGNCTQWDGSGGVGDSGIPCSALGAFKVVALWNGSSGTLVDDNEGGSGYESGAVNWGTTITGTYYVDCFTTGWTLGSTLGRKIVATTVGIPIDGTTFTYGVDIPTISAGRGNTIPSVTCMAIQ